MIIGAGLLLAKQTPPTWSFVGAVAGRGVNLTVDISIISVQSGDIIVYCMTNDQSSGVTAWPSGYTTISSDSNRYVAWKIAGVTNSNLTFTNNNASAVCGVVVIRGIDTSFPVEASGIPTGAPLLYEDNDLISSTSFTPLNIGACCVTFGVVTQSYDTTSNITNAPATIRVNQSLNGTYSGLIISTETISSLSSTQRSIICEVDFFLDIRAFVASIVLRQAI